MQTIVLIATSLMLLLTGCSSHIKPREAKSGEVPHTNYEQPMSSVSPPSAPTMSRTKANESVLLKPLGAMGEVASYYNRHLAIKEGIVYGWTDDGIPKAMMDSAVQVGVGDTTSFALLKDGQLLAWFEDPKAIIPIAENIVSFSAGRTGVFAIKQDGLLMRFESPGKPGVEIAKDVVFSSIGDGTDYYITNQGDVFARGLAHRGQFGDGRLESTEEFVKVASNGVQVKGHTGHAILLKSNGDVQGTGGNIYGPLGNHGLGDKAITWGNIFTRAKIISTGSSHSVAIKDDSTLWIWGAKEGTQPHQVMEQVVAVAGGTNMTLAKTIDGSIWFWQTGMNPRKIL
ncbi:RCC1 domain-containing protein [Paenibacillus sp. LjRoot56]|uniref:RCC1 domain-containing protein n=1 Tax=Paenibacillus sp. LjRoot56 TaxID=3342333 RepID=UPI003ECDFF2E